MRDHPHPRNGATGSVQPNYAGAIRGTAYGSCSPARYPGQVVREDWHDASRCSQPAHLS